MAESKAETKYVVLSEQDGSWSLIGKYDGRNPAEAIKASMFDYDSDPDLTGTFVAVPERSWQPKRVEAQRSVKLTLSDPVAPQGASF